MSMTFENFDKLDRKPFADRLTKAISNFYKFIDGAYVLSLNAKFGSGKTTFLKMWEHDLIQKDHKVIYLNAWETDFDEDPIIPLVACLLDALEDNSSKSKAETALKVALGATTLIGNKLIEHSTGFNLGDFVEKVREKVNSDDLNKLGTEIYRSYSFKLKAYKELREALKNYVAAIEVKPLIILIDELDRVRPDYSVKFLEAIKHIFPIPGICFVLAVDRKQLESSVRQLYGDVDFDNYYRRFITRETALTIPANFDRSRYIQHLGEEYFDRKDVAGLNFCFKTEERRELLARISVTSQIFNLTPRQVEYLFRVFVHLFAVERTDRLAKDSWVHAAILLIAIMINKPSLYNALGNEKVSVRELADYLGELNYSDTLAKQKGRILSIALAFNLRENDPENDATTAEVLAAYRGTTVSDLNSLAQITDVHGILHLNSSFSTIYKIIEDWKPFIE
jgi:hypothetical protein